MADTAFHPSEDSGLRRDFEKVSFTQTHAQTHTHAHHYDIDVDFVARLGCFNMSQLSQELCENCIVGG